MLRIGYPYVKTVGMRVLTNAPINIVVGDDPNESHNLMGNADITIRNIRDSLNEKLLASMQHISDPVITRRDS